MWHRDRVTDSRTALEKVIRHAVELEDDYLDIAPTVEALASSGEVTLVPDLAAALDRFLDEENFYGRDLIAAVLAGIQGTAALPVLLRASARDLGDDQDSLQTEIVELLHADPASCRPTVLAFVASDEAALRRVGLWALGFVTETVDATVLAAAATDPDPAIRSMAVGSVGDPAHDDEAFGVPLRALGDADDQVRTSITAPLYRGRR